MCVGLVACAAEEPPSEFLPDSLLRVELGMTDADRVHSIRVTGGEVETLDPREVHVPPGAWVQFVTTDWRVHSVRFDPDSLPPEGREFLERTGQLGSPPMVERDARFLVSFADAPEGRYPFVAEGNGAPAYGVVVVLPSR